MSIRELNAQKATRRCLRCGKPMWTDRCHRICTKCSHTNEAMGEPYTALTRDVRLVRQQTGEGLVWKTAGLCGLAVLTAE